MNLSNQSGERFGGCAPCSRLLRSTQFAVCGCATAALILSSAGTWAQSAAEYSNLAKQQSAAVAETPKPGTTNRNDAARKAGGEAAKDSSGDAGAAPLCNNYVAAPVSVSVIVGKSTLLKLPAPIVRRTLGNEEVVQARMLSDKVIYLLGIASGSTNMVLQDKAGNCNLMDVVVAIDSGALQEKLGQLFPEEKDVRVSAAGDMLVLSGSVADSARADDVVALAQGYLHGVRPRSAGAAGGTPPAGAGNVAVNASSGTAKVPGIVNMLSVAAPQQVMLEVKIAEVSKTLLDSFGIDVSRASVLADGSMIRFLSGIFGGASAAVGQITGTGPGGVPLSSVGAVVGGTVPAAVGAGGNVTMTYDANNRPLYTTTYGTVPGRGVTNIGIDAKHNNELVKILAQPTVMALSGQEGSFLAGGKIFIPIVQNSNGASTITLQEEEFGVGLRFTPTVLDHGRINLRVSPEVSELSTQGVSVSASSTGSTSILPLITTRRASTTVQLHDGQSFIIGGLIKNNVTQNIHAFPILGELPIIGALFRSTEFQSDKSELVFLITPHIAKALPPDYKLPTDHFVEPSRSEMFLQGKMEGDAARAADPASNPVPNPAPATAPVATPTPKPADAPSGSELK